MIKSISIWSASFFCILGCVAMAAVEEGLVGYWPFDEGTGQVAQDVSGNGLEGKFAGNPQWVEGKLGMALEFDGVQDHVVVADNALLDITTDLTLTAWFRPNEALTSRRLMVKNDSIFVIFDFGDTNTIDLLVKPNNDFVESTTNDWTVGEWYHFAGTFDGSTLRVYINGTLEGEQDIGVKIAPSDLEFWIGGDDFGRPTDHFPGTIDEVRIYDKTLAEAQIKTLMDTGQAVEPTSKLATSWGRVKSTF